MNESDFQASIAQQRSLRKNAYSSTVFRHALSLADKKARFPGFYQRKVNYHAGQMLSPGALPILVDMIMHESVPMTLQDGTSLYSDIFIPAGFEDISAAPEKERVPALIAWSPYGKQLGSTILDDFPMRAGVPKHWLSGLQKWEGPDPAYWCANGYAVINVDTRGAYTAEGDLLMFGHQEAEDGAEFITWVSKQPWCSGKVALTGNSWLAIAQWKIASLRPKGLAAVAPWEGLDDHYREAVCKGGIPNSGFHHHIANTLASQGRMEDIVQALENNSLWSDYFADKKADKSRINVPVYAAASWTNPIHTPGTFRAWSLVPDSVPKWLRVHNTQEWPDYYSHQSTEDLRRFFDYYLLGRHDNNWLITPKVRLSVLKLGLGDQTDTVNRVEAEWPLARTKSVRYYLQQDNTLSPNPPVAAASTVSYKSTSSPGTTFTFTMPSSCETTGYFLAHLQMSTQTHDEMDIFVQITKLSPAKYRQGVLTIPPTSLAMKALLKLMHDWSIGLSKVGLLFHWDPDGCLRASHALDKLDDHTLSAQERVLQAVEPRYKHTRRVPLKKDEVRALDIPFRPYGMYWEKGDTLQLTVAGRPVILFPLPGIKPPMVDNQGMHVIHCGRRGGESSYLRVPMV